MPKTMTKLDMFAVRLAEFVTKRRWLVIFCALLVTVAAASGGQYLEFSSNYRVFFSKANPELQAFEEFQATYTKNDNILFTIMPPEGDVFNPKTLSLVEDLTAEAWQIPYSIRVDSISNFQHTYAEEDDLIVEDLFSGAAGLSMEEIEAKRVIALDEPLLKGQLITESGSATSVNVVVQYPEKSLEEVPEAVAFARNLREQLQAKYPNHQIYLTGVSMLNNAFVEAGMTDMATMIPLMYLILIVLMIVVVRSFSGTLTTVLMIFFSSAIGMGVAGFAGVKLTPISAAAPTVIMTLAIADAIHILITMRNAMKQGMEKRDALIEAVRVNFLAVTITSLTTAIGFLALNYSDAPPFWHLGNISAVGIVFAWLLSVTFLPAMMSLLPVVRPKAAVAEGAGFMSGFADFVIRNNKKLFFGSSAFALALLALVPTLEFNDQWIEYFDERVEFRRDSDQVTPYFGFYPIEFSVLSEGPGGISEPEFLEAMGEFTDWARQQPNVTHVYSLTDIMKRLNRNMHADAQDWYHLPDERDLAAQYLLLYELSLPYGLDLNDRINTDKSATRITVTLSSASTTTQTKAFLNNAKAWFADNAPAYMKPTIPTGAQVMFTYVAERNVDNMITGNIIAVFAIGLVMILTLQSLRLGLLSMIPNALPILTAFGAWSFLVGTVGFSVAAVASVSLGIVVDDTVHFLTKYIRGTREKGLNREDAVRYAFETVGWALVANTVILVAGFAYLATSSFKMNADMGLLTAMSIAFALLFDFLLLPTFLLIGRSQDQQTLTDKKGEGDDPEVQLAE